MGKGEERPDPKLLTAFVKESGSLLYNDRTLNSRRTSQDDPVRFQEERRARKPAKGMVARGREAPSTGLPGLSPCPRLLWAQPRAGAQSTLARQMRISTHGLVGKSLPTWLLLENGF